MLVAKRRAWRVAGLWWFSWLDQDGACQFCGAAGWSGQRGKIFASTFSGG